MLYFISFIAAMIITMLLIPPLMRTARYFDVVDNPGPRKVHQSVIPRIGGIAMVIGACLPIMLWTEASGDIVGYVAGVCVILIFGVLDDRYDLNYKIKFAGQVIAIVLVLLSNDIVISKIPFFNELSLHYIISIPITVISLLGITNAINLTDGLDGLAGGTALLSLGLITVLAYQDNNIHIVLICLAILGSILGFLRFNTYPADVFMGDAGSQFLGFSLGVLSLLLTQQGVSI
jgi:UDP-GlcNAc:undecaprenyl-phosphate GlcNAc-1-phosphate transferase